MRRQVFALRQHKFCAAFVLATGWGDKDFDVDKRQIDVIKDRDGDLLFADSRSEATDGMAAGNDGERKYVAADDEDEAVTASARNSPPLSRGGGNDKRGNKLFFCRQTAYKVADTVSSSSSFEVVFNVVLDDE